MPRVKNSVPETRGLGQLLELLRDRNQKQLAEETRVAQSIISDIVNRVRLPSLEQALAFEKLGIAPSAWAEQTGAQGAA